MKNKKNYSSFFINYIIISYILSKKNSISFNSILFKNKKCTSL